MKKFIIMTLLFLGSLIPPQVVRAQGGCDITVTDGTSSGLQSAINSVADGGIICLETDISVVDYSFHISNKNNVTIYGNGHTMTGVANSESPTSIYVEYSSNITINNLVFATVSDGNSYVSNVDSFQSSVTVVNSVLNTDDPFFGTLQIMSSLASISTGCNTNEEMGYNIGSYILLSSCPSAYLPTPTATNTPPPASTSTPTPGPCGTDVQCLATVIAQNATIIANLVPTATPNSFTVTLSSGAVFEIGRKSDYGSIFTSASLIFLSSVLALGGVVALVAWRR